MIQDSDVTRYKFASQATKNTRVRANVIEAAAFKRKKETTQFGRSNYLIDMLMDVLQDN